jgi:hypothetical protein
MGTSVEVLSAKIFDEIKGQAAGLFVMMEWIRIFDSRSSGCKSGIPAWMLQDICCG